MDDIATPIIRKLTDGETAHKVAILAAQLSLTPHMPPSSSSVLCSSPFRRSPSLTFPTPIGLAAGFDKHGDVPGELLASGFGSVEVGSITPLPQPGNPPPRVFRLLEDNAVINRYGFNSHGHHIAHSNLAKYRNSLSNSQSQCDKSPKPKISSAGVLGVNLGKNKTSASPINDYVAGIHKFAPLADYLVVNVSSPNTPGLRSMQKREVLKELLGECLKARDEACSKCELEKIPLLVKVAPDLGVEERRDVAKVVLEVGIDGVICGNTTMERPESLRSECKKESGGLSGEPLRDMSTKLVRDMFEMTKGEIVIVGVGGVASGKDALDKIEAGASLVQLYTAITYKGPGLGRKCAEELKDLLEKDNVENIKDVIGRKTNVKKGVN